MDEAAPSGDAAQAVGAVPGRLTWRCRRGMKELDLVLRRYLQERWPQADADERAAFERILELPDPELAACLMGRGKPADPRMAQVMATLRGD